jgi:two-component system chemotaxis response regulator CheY
MEVLRHHDLKQFLAFFPKIKSTIGEWRLINVSLEKDSSGSIFYIARKLRGFLSHTDGQILICNNRNLLALVKTGKGSDIEQLQKDILIRFPDYDCTVAAVETTNEGLHKLELHFGGKSFEGILTQGGNASLMLQERVKRQKNVILIADDDQLILAQLKNFLEPYATVIALQDGTEVVDTCLQIMPDILILDLHLPGQSGMDILDEILMFDQDAYVLMLSSDTDRNNVLNARKIGAKGFIAKPFTKEKLEEALWKCPTMKKKNNP